MEQDEFYGAITSSGQHGNHIKFKDISILNANGAIMDVRRAAQKAKKASKRWDEVSKNIETAIELANKYKIKGAASMDELIALLTKAIVEDDSIPGPSKRKNVIIVQECMVAAEILQ